MATPEFQHYVRIAQVDCPGQKALVISLQKIKGIGDSFANAICQATGMDKQQKTGTLTKEQVEKLTNFIQNPDLPKWLYNRRKDYESGDDKHLLTGTLGYVKDNDLKRLKKIKSYRGMRHQRKLPVRGQRTKSNFRRSKGNVVAVRKKAK
tara:strand:+ start:143 stop:592 length:450 start_codon:yes stop_codon:yes gene_type:complete